ncbi:MAG: MTH938/NDUFAF3 family protein [Proteobacteria bacterium]|nr:MTH938/NDUFAF3 family protein [Pseudomonadota bacterium]
MKIELDSENSSSNKIISYSDDSFKLKDKIIKSNIIISKDRLIENWSVNDHGSLALQHLDQIISWQPEIIILGTGKQPGFPDLELISHVTSKNIGFETMDTGAACRIYNLLIDEGRNVGACLFLSGI